MRFVEGCSLGVMLQQARTDDSPTHMTPQEAARLAMQAAQALRMPTRLGSFTATSSLRTCSSSRAVIFGWRISVSLISRTVAT